MGFAYRPSAVIELSGRELTAAEAGLRSLTVAFGLGCHGFAEMAFAPGTAFSDAAEQDALGLSLGPAGDEALVLTGRVSARRRGAGATVLEALDLGGQLSRTRKTITFEESAVDDIVARIAGEAELRVDSDASDTLAIYYVQANRPLWDHLRDLATLTGRDLSVDPAGALLFRQPDAGTSHTLRHGAELLTWSISEGETPAAVQRAHHGSASESGHWHWVNPDPLGEDPPPARIRGVLSDRELAERASAAAATGRVAFEGWLMVTGDAAIRPADSLVIEDLPGGDPDPLRVRAVRHSLDGARGFVTVLEVEGGGSGGGLLGGLL